MLVGDILQDAKSSKGYGSCESVALYAAITDSVRMLANRVREWDWTLASAKFRAFDGYLVLPREVETPIAANVNGVAAWPRDRWFVHHINGPGCYSGESNKYWTEVDTVSTFKQMPWEGSLTVVPEDISDVGKAMLIYGYDWEDRELQHKDEDGNWVKGMSLIMSQDSPSSFPIPTLVKSITKVIKDETNGEVSLWAYDISPLARPIEKIGLYYPDEIEPTYRRLKFPKDSEVMLTYRRKSTNYTNAKDWIPFESKTALLLALKSIRFMYDGDLARAQVFEDKAVDLLRNEEMSKKVRTSVGPQVRNYSSHNNERLRGGYGYGC